VLDSYIFETLADVHTITQRWVNDYNYERPYDALEGMSPIMYINQKLLGLRSATLLV
jgi:putative transposase